MRPAARGLNRGLQAQLILMAKSFKRACIIAGLVLAVVALCLGLWRKVVVAKRATVALAAIQSGVAGGDFVAARAALPSIADPGMREAMEREIRLGELKSALATRDTGLMRLALGSDGANWINPGLREAADVELAREAMQARDDTGYQVFVEKWAAKSGHAGQWTLLEADRLLARKLPDDARELLRNAQLSGVADAQRHARLALLEAKEPWKAMGTIDEGLKADPRNADLLSFRAQIEEAAGRLDEARLDYVAAVLCGGNNPLHRDQLGGFYLRVGNLAAAAETWREAAAETHLGVYALKGWFWARVGGTPLSQPLPSCHQQGWSNLITALAATPDNVFWSASLDAELAAIRGASERPEVLWLRLLEALRSKAFYVGALGSGRNQQKRRERLLSFDLTEADISRLHGPVGLQIGSRTPAEIAVAVAAQLVQERRVFENARVGGLDTPPSDSAT